ncbi:hypothetical protein BGX34_010254, partial [Mortierella sp. NVP85]
TFIPLLYTFQLTVGPISLLSWSLQRLEFAIRAATLGSRLLYCDPASASGPAPATFGPSTTASDSVPAFASSTVSATVTPLPLSQLMSKPLSLPLSPAISAAVTAAVSDAVDAAAAAILEAADDAAAFGPASTTASMLLLTLLLPLLRLLHLQSCS